MSFRSHATAYHHMRTMGTVYEILLGQRTWLTPLFRGTLQGLLPQSMQLVCYTPRSFSTLLSSVISHALSHDSDLKAYATDARSRPLRGIRYGRLELLRLILSTDYQRSCGAP